MVFLHNSRQIQETNQFKNNWYAETASFPKMRTFIKFKTSFKMESYLLSIKNHKLRKLFSRFRLSNHDLEIERSHYHKPAIPADQRICQHCNSLSVEDEEHVIMQCKAYENPRSIFMSNVSEINSDICNEGFVSIISTSDPRNIFYICKFLEKIFYYRKTHHSKVSI